MRRGVGAIGAVMMQASLHSPSCVLFERAFAEAAVGIALVSPEGYWLHVNKRLCEIVGYAEVALKGKTFQDITHPDDLHTDLGLMDQVIAGELSTYSIEKRYLRADGAVVWVELTVSLLRDADGKPEQFISIVTEITARKQVEIELANLRDQLEGRVELRTQEMRIVIEQLNHQIEKRVSIQQALGAEKARFEATLENATDAFVEFDECGVIVAWNRAAEGLFGWTRQEVLDQPIANLLIPERMRSAYQLSLDHYLSTGKSNIKARRLETSALHKNGHELAVELTVSESRFGERRLIDAFLHDISKRKENERTVLESRTRLKTITDNMPALIAYVDSDLRFQFNNRTYEDWFGLTPEQLLGTTLPDFMGDTAYARAKPFIDEAMTGKRISFENVLDARNGTMYMLTTVIPKIGENTKVEGFYTLSLDMTERKLLEKRLVYEATHDSLTSLPNRRAFTVRLGEAMARSQRNKQGLALLFLDMDGFKSLNDRYGHEFGDHVLQYFASLLCDAVRQTDTVARLAGDEFTIILEGLEEPESGAIRVAEKILARLAKPCLIDGISLTLAASIGATTVSATHGKIALDSLLAKADSAMYRAKAAGKGRFALN